MDVCILFNLLKNLNKSTYMLKNKCDTLLINTIKILLKISRYTIYNFVIRTSHDGFIVLYIRFGVGQIKICPGLLIYH